MQYTVEYYDLFEQGWVICCETDSFVEAMRSFNESNDPVRLTNLQNRHTPLKSGEVGDGF